MRCFMPPSSSGVRITHIKFSHNSNIFISIRLAWNRFEYFPEELLFHREFLRHAWQLFGFNRRREEVGITECGRPHLCVKTSATDQFAYNLHIQPLVSVKLMWIVFSHFEIDDDLIWLCHLMKVWVRVVGMEYRNATQLLSLLLNTHITHRKWQCKCLDGCVRFWCSLAHRRRGLICVHGTACHVSQNWKCHTANAQPK